MPRSKKNIPITSRIRIEFYLPQRPGQRRSEELDHIALVVTNCGTRAARDNTRIPHDDDKVFSVVISAR